MKRIKNKLPHHKVYTRLQPSKIHGVGVFAIVNIGKGTQIFYGDEGEEMTWIKKNQLNKLPKPIQKLYDDFCVLKNGEYGCPKNFNSMTISWYLNSSKNPNVAADKDYVFHALRDIKKGEELTADYDAYSE